MQNAFSAAETLSLNPEIRQTCLDCFTATFQQPPAVIARAPGRLEVLGNHTDYNEGLVISCAVDRSTWFMASPSPDDTFRIKLAADNDETTFTLADLDSPIKGHWSNYVKGVIVELQARGHQVSPFQAVLMGDVPLSAGMSSSAALEMAACLAIGKLNNIDLPKPEWARIGQACENKYVGANTGLLDQFTSLMGEANQLVRIDFRTLETSTISCPENAVFVVANSGVKHDLTLEYNERRERCEEAARDLKVKALRDVTPQQLEAGKPTLDIMAYRRAKHVVGECDRVNRAAEALADEDLPTFGQILFESHASSIDNFENSCSELDILVEASRSLPGCYGARLSGGGFGGISIHLVEKAQADLFQQRLAEAFKSRTGRELQTMICQVGQGAEIDV